MANRRAKIDAAPRSITEIRPLPSDPNLRSVRVDGRAVARLRASIVEELDLVVGQRWTAALAARVESKQREEKARKAALTMLGRRALSSGELLERLRGRGYDEATARAVVDQLTRDHWIDDAAYARSLAEELLRRRGASRPLIIERLRARSVDPCTAEAAADDVLADTDPVHEALRLMKKKLAGSGTTSPEAKVRRISGLLARRGYDEDTIETVLRRLDLMED